MRKPKYPSSIASPRIKWCILNEENGQLLYAVNEMERVPIASLTKIITAMIVLDIASLDKSVMTKPIFISWDAATVGGTTSYLRRGDSLTANDLIYGMMLPSGNDAALALAEYFGGILKERNTKYSGGGTNVDIFIQAMNNLCRDSGALSTNCTNPHGMDEDEHLSTAMDISLLACKALKSEQFQKIVNTRSYSAKITNRHGVARFEVWNNTNKLLAKEYKDLYKGVKTGTTDNAGCCLCSLVSRAGGKNLLITVLFAENDDERYIITDKLYQFSKKATIFSVQAAGDIWLSSIRNKKSRSSSPYSVASLSPRSGGGGETKESSSEFNKKNKLLNKSLSFSTLTLLPSISPSNIEAEESNNEHKYGGEEDEDFGKKGFSKTTSFSSIHNFSPLHVDDKTGGGSGGRDSKSSTPHRSEDEDVELSSNAMSKKSPKINNNFPLFSPINSDKPLKRLQILKPIPIKV